MYVCVCNAVTERQVRQAISQGAVTVRQLKHELDVAGECGSCHDCLEDYLAQAFALESASLGPPSLAD